MADFKDSLPVDIAGVKCSVLDVVYLCDMCARVYASALQYLTADSACEYLRSGKSA